MWDEFKEIKSGKRELCEFGLTIGVILVILGGTAFWRAKAIYPYLFIAGLLFIIAGLTRPQVLKPAQKIWMGFSIVLGFFMSRLVLMILFYAVITPISLLLRLSGKDILDEQIDRSRISYWIETREAKSKKSYLNQY